MSEKKDVSEHKFIPISREEAVMMMIGDNVKEVYYESDNSIKSVLSRSWKFGDSQNTYVFNDFKFFKKVDINSNQEPVMINLRVDAKLSFDEIAKMVIKEMEKFQIR